MTNSLKERDILSSLEAGGALGLSNGPLPFSFESFSLRYLRVPYPWLPDLGRDLNRVPENLGLGLIRYSGTERLLLPLFWRFGGVVVVAWRPISGEEPSGQMSKPFHDWPLWLAREKGPRETVPVDWVDLLRQRICQE